MKNRFTSFWSKGLIVLCVIALGAGFMLAGCDNGSADGGGGGGGNGGSGTWALLVGTWKTDDGKLEYKFNDGSMVDGVDYGMVTIDGEYPYYSGSFFWVETVTREKVSGDTESFDFVLSDNNQTLTVSNFQDGKVRNLNGVLRKQP
jgi:hypothetical protein